MANDQVGIIGSGEAFDSGYGNNSCLLFGTGIPSLLFDCGYQIPERLWALSSGLSSVDAVYLTHFHADHAMGLAPLLMRYQEEKRKKSLAVFGPKGLESYARRLLDLAYPGSFKKLSYPIQFSEKDSGERWAWKSLKFECAATRHSVRNLAVRVGLPSGKSVFISGDGLITPESAALACRSDLILHETYTARPAAMIHSSLHELRENLETAPGRIVLTHFRRDERHEIMAALKRLRKTDKRWSAAAPGQVLRI